MISNIMFFCKAALKQCVSLKKRYMSMLNNLVREPYALELVKRGSETVFLCECQV